MRITKPGGTILSTLQCQFTTTGYPSYTPTDEKQAEVVRGEFTFIK